MNLFKFFSLLIVLFISSIAFGQLKKLTLEDAVLGYYKGLYPKGLRNLQWVKNSNNYSYVTEKGLEIKEAKTQKEVRLVSNEELKKVLPELERFPYVESINEYSFTFTNGQSIYIYNYISKEISSVGFKETASNQDYHGASKNLAYTIDNNLWVNYKGENKAVTNNEDKNIVSGQAIHRFEFGISKGTFWSPSGKLLAFSQKDETNVADYPLLDINQTPGKLNSIKYPMAGQKSEHGKIGVYNPESNKTIYLETGEPLEHYLTNTTWGPNEKYIYLTEVNRDQNHLWLNQYDVKTGKKVKTLFEEKNEKWVEPEHGLFFMPKNPNEFLWLSERDGFMNLYHYNTDGKLIQQLTSNDWVISDVLGFDLKGENVIIKGTGEDAREMHAFSVNLKTKTIKRLTQELGVHNVQYNSTANAIIDSYSSVSTPKQIDILQLGKKKTLKTSLLTAPNPLKEYKYGPTDLLTLTSKSGERLYGRMIKPHDFDASKKYPVLVYVYGGPHAQLVTNSWLGGASLWMHWMAEQGYIVFTVDGRGSKNRGFEFESGIHRQLGELEIEDQLTGVDYLKSLPYVDASRLAVHGWSFGGFMTTSLMLKAPGVFTTGVAGGPVIDWKWYEVMYGERYMDTPQKNKEGYEKASLLNYVKNLEGELLMIHGTSDDVVVMQHNLAFVQKCVSEGVQIDFFPYPMHPHNVRGKDRVHLMTKVLNYIIKNNK